MLFLVHVLEINLAHQSCSVSRSVSSRIGGDESPCWEVRSDPPLSPQGAAVRPAAGSRTPGQAT